MAEHVASACLECGAVDDHPKLHYGPSTYHHDCTPSWIVSQLSGHAVTAVEAARNGVRGPDLRAHIVALHEEN